MSYIANCVTLLGLSHQQSRKPCQDASGFFIGDDYSVSIVADGHGSMPHIRSAIGSKLAVECALDAIQQRMSDSDIETLEELERIVDDLEKTIIDSWMEKTKRDYTEKPLDPDEMKSLKTENSEFDLKYYGTTLVIGVLSERFSFGIQVGDGRLIALRNNEIDLDFIEPDPACDGEITTSMSSDNVYEIIRHRIEWGSNICGFLACTDGFSESFDEISLKTYAKGIISLMGNEEWWYSSIVNQVRETTKRGNQDDSSISVSIRDSVDFDSLYKETFHSEGSRLRSNNRPLIVRKIARAEIPWNSTSKQLMEKWIWTTKFGHTYMGTVIDGKPNGGLIFNGWKYEGKIINFERNDDNGRETYPVSPVEECNQKYHEEYHGGFKNGFRNGHGTYEIFCQPNQQTNKQNSESKKIFQFDGGFKDGWPEGEGWITYSESEISERCHVIIKRKRTDSTNTDHPDDSQIYNEEFRTDILKKEWRLISIRPVDEQQQTKPATEIRTKNHRNRLIMIQKRKSFKVRKQKQMMQRKQKLLMK